ncbi:unnamed protein product [Durusdinium trenchii]|uniref:Uncharacterized protein n=1 Tax=Durusdinium trenchii TaxID=1381693 RepID=A0ABP0HBF8_9DINO
MGNNTASSCHQRCDKVAVEYAGAGIYALASQGRHPDGDLQGSEALLCHKMLVAAKDGREDELKMLLEQGLPVDRRRPFFMKREQEDVEVVAPANARRVHGMTALMYASQAGYPKCCIQLLLAKADTNCEDEDGMRPLHFAATSGSLYVCELLIQHRADVEAKADDGKTALDMVPDDAVPTAKLHKRWQELLEANAPTKEPATSPPENQENPNDVGNRPKGVDKESES